MAVGTMTKRVRMLETIAGDQRGPTRLVMDDLTAEERGRVAVLLADREAGCWANVTELATPDLRILSRIRVVPLDGGLGHHTDDDLPPVTSIKFEAPEMKP